MPKQTTTNLTTLVQYTAHTAIALQELAETGEIPFLISTSALTSSILKSVKVNFLPAGRRLIR
jgi:hypothetical protein